MKFVFLDSIIIIEITYYKIFSYIGLRNIKYKCWNYSQLQHS